LPSLQPVVAQEAVDRRHTAHRIFFLRHVAQLVEYDAAAAGDVALKALA